MSPEPWSIPGMSPEPVAAVLPVMVMSGPPSCLSHLRCVARPAGAGRASSLSATHPAIPPVIPRRSC